MKKKMKMRKKKYKIRKYSIAWFVVELVPLWLVLILMLGFHLIANMPQEQPTVQTEILEESVQEVQEVIYETEFDYYCGLIRTACEIHEVEPTLAIAISRLETGNFKSEAFKIGHNFGGLTGTNGIYTYNAESDGIEAYMNCLEWYQDKGMTTPEQMANTYCPHNAKNWCESVKEIMKEIEKHDCEN